MEAVSRLRSGEAGSAAVFDGLVRSAVADVVAAAGCAVLQLLMAVMCSSCTLLPGSFTAKRGEIRKPGRLAE